MYTRCAKGYFVDNASATMGMGRCWGHDPKHVGGRRFGRCRHLRKCLRMSIAQWHRRFKDIYGGNKAINYSME